MAKTLQRGKGRPRRPYVTSWGEHVNGLRRRPHDLRWVVVETGEMFSEPDERMAVLRFRRSEAKRNGSHAMLTLDFPPSDVDDVIAGAVDFTIRKALGVGDHHAKSDESLILRIAEHEPLMLLRAVPEGALWTYVAEQIRSKPEYVAKQTGIEQISYLLDIKKPEKLPTFERIETLWTEKNKSQDRHRVLADWKTFVAGSGATALNDITTARVIKYKELVYSRNLSGKRQSHLFNRARRMISFAKSQALAMSACTTALEAMSLMNPNTKATVIDPDPISRDEFQALLKVAKRNDRAILLLMLNCALHGVEVCQLQWKDFKGDVLIAHRKKTGKFLRIATLWKETVGALADLEKKGEYVFVSQKGTPLNVSGFWERFRKLRDAADVTVKSDQIRDGAATAAAAANVNESLLNLLMGHRNPGMKDNYAKRNPEMVRPACDAIHRVYGPF